MEKQEVRNCYYNNTFYRASHQSSTVSEFKMYVDRRA